MAFCCARKSDNSGALVFNQCTVCEVVTSMYAVQSEDLHLQASVFGSEQKTAHTWLMHTFFPLPALKSLHVHVCPLLGPQIPDCGQLMCSQAT